MSSSIHAPGSTFHPYKRLPQELRDQIWEFVISDVGPRAVEVRWGYSEEQKHPIELFSTCPIPKPLHICHDSRQVALHRWQLSFPVRNGQARIFFDHQDDTLSLPITDVGLFTNEVWSKHRLNMHSMALGLRNQSFRERLGTHTAQIMRGEFPKLDQLLFICDEVRHPYFEHKALRTKTIRDCNGISVTTGYFTGYPIQDSYFRLADAFCQEHIERGWGLPELGFMDYRRTKSNTLVLHSWRELFVEYSHLLPDFLS